MKQQEQKNQNIVENTGGEMGQFQPITEMHGRQLEQARQLFFDRGVLPEGLVKPMIIRSWERCRRFGLSENGYLPGVESLDRVALKTE